MEHKEHAAHEGETVGRGDVSRRTFLKATAAAAIAGGTARSAAGQDAAPAVDRRNERPDRMTYQVLGRTNFSCSRLVFGCGAALAGGKAVRLLERSFESGINFYDVGYDDYYKGSEGHLAPFLKRHREAVWVTSKAPARVERGVSLTPEVAQRAADYWSNELDKSLSRLQVDYMDAYYFMGISDPELVRSEELANAFFAAKTAGKVGHLGISTHTNAQECLEAAVDTGWYSLAMIAITPGGWYDYGVRKLVRQKGTMVDARPVLERAREAGIGLVGMKAARPIAATPYGGKYGRVEDAAPESSFDEYYPDRLMKSAFTPFQRTYAYVLHHGVDVVNSDMQNFKHLEQNLIAAMEGHTYFS